MKFWTFLRKKIGALDCNWCIILKSLCKEMSLGAGGGGGEGGDQRFWGKGEIRGFGGRGRSEVWGDIPGLPPPV